LKFGESKSHQRNDSFGFFCSLGKPKIERSSTGIMCVSNSNDHILAMCAIIDGFLVNLKFSFPSPATGLARFHVDHEKTSTKNGAGMNFKPQNWMM